MRDGEIVQIGTPEEIMSQPVDDYVAEFTRDVRRSTVITVGYLMQNSTTQVNAEDSPSHAIQTMKTANSEAAFVATENGRYLGELTLAEAQAAESRNDTSVSAAVNRRYLPVFAKECVEDALSKAWSQDGNLPVIDDTGVLVGQIERDALIQATFDSEEALA